MSKRSKNRAQQSASRAKGRSEQLLEETDGAATRMSEDVRRGVDNMRDRGGTTTSNAKARNKR